MEPGLLVAGAVVVCFAALLGWIHSNRGRRNPAPEGPPIFRETMASGREVSLALNRIRGARNCLIVEVYDDQIRLKLPYVMDALMPLELATGMPTAILRRDLHAAYGKGDNILLEFADGLGRERGVELNLKRSGGFLAALTS